MSDKELLKAIGLNDRTISLSVDDEYLQIMLEKKIDNYLKQQDEERKKKEEIDFLKKRYDEFKEKDEFVKRFDDKYIFNKVKDKMIQSGFIYRCKFCWGMDLSGQYGKRKQEWKD